MRVFIIKTHLPTSHAGRARASNVFKSTPGMAFCLRRQASKSPYMAWKLFIDESIFRQVQNYTVIEARKQNSQWGVSSDLLEAFIALQYARGIYGKRHFLESCGMKGMGQTFFVKQCLEIRLSLFCAFSNLMTNLPEEDD